MMRSYSSVYNEIDDLIINYLNKDNVEFEAMKRYKVCCRFFLTKRMKEETYYWLMKEKLTELFFKLESPCLAVPVPVNIKQKTR